MVNYRGLHAYFREPGFWDFFNETPLGFKLFFGAIFIFIFGSILIAIVTGLSRWLSNNRAPQISEVCKVIGKRDEVSGGSGNSSIRQQHYVAFELRDGSRVELQVKPEEYGLIAEGDQGTVSYQGTRFLAFNREMNFTQHLNM
ncbi:DUF2500 domain-containing protein [Paenibacillus sp. SC116]|uniref:DUF2500 domain-containing protein n=1 Tax=Paenibacillus sp. SC116 TaxID=2968986 RepID=UPI00215ADCFF|nr:DUF2500 domain-containing protein [Paenibacillus sp. SC116]MCR8845117.1 DUF2500 domain-containing protein [Paenibacillus sp. SC116]